MRHLFLPLLFSLSLFFAPAMVWGADAKPNAAAADQPTGGAEARQPAADQAPTEPKADEDAGRADSERPDSGQDGAGKPKRQKLAARPTSMAIIPVRAGLKTLNIHFRWSLFPNSSIEVRLVPGPPQKGATVTPIYFAEHLKGTVREALYTCLDHPGASGHTYSFTKDKLVYKMIGCRNSLGSQGVHVQVQPEDSKTPDKYPAAAYLQLDTWAVDKETLSLDLARDEFAQPGTLFVWFFRGDRAIWEEQIRWPGYR